jgi:hypothetical protein
MLTTSRKKEEQREPVFKKVNVSLKQRKPISCDDTKLKHGVRICRTSKKETHQV